MAEPGAENADSAIDELKRRARWRLIGAVVLALAAATLLPLLLEQEQKPLGDDVSVQIPPVDGGKFVTRIPTDKNPAPSVDARPEPGPSAPAVPAAALAPVAVPAAPVPAPVAPPVITAPPAAPTLLTPPRKQAGGAEGGASRQATPTGKQDAAHPPAPKAASSPAAKAESPPGKKPEAASGTAPKTAAAPAARTEPQPGRKAEPAAPTPAPKGATAPAKPEAAPAGKADAAQTAPKGEQAATPSATAAPEPVPAAKSDSAAPPAARADTAPPPAAKPASAAPPAAKADSARPPAPKSDNGHANPVPKGDYAVQLGAFTDSYGATTLVAKLKKSGYAAYTEVTEYSRGTLYRVRVGGFATKQAANQARTKLKADGHDGRVVATK